MPTEEEYQALRAVTPKGGWTQDVNPYGYIFSNDQGSVFFPALGRNNTEVNSYGNYLVLGGKRFSVNGADAYLVMNQLPAHYLCGLCAVCRIY